MNVRARGIVAFALVLFIGSSLWAHALRVDRCSDLGRSAPDLPGLRLIDASVSSWQRQVIYLDFDGEQNVVYNGPVAIGSFDIPAFQAPGDLAGSEVEVMASVTAHLNDLFAGTGVLFTLDQPQEAGTYSTVYIGGDGSWALEHGSFLGLAEQVDIDNQDRADNAFVFTDRLSSPTVCAMVYADTLADLIAHEVGHLLGYSHVGRGSSDVLSDVAQLLRPPFADTQGFHDMTPYKQNVGIQGVTVFAASGSEIDAPAGEIKNCTVLGSVALGLNGQDETAGILGTFTVPSTGRYSVILSGHVRGLMSTVGIDILIGKQKGSFQSWIEAEILVNGQSPPDARGMILPLYSSDLTLKKFLSETAWDVIWAALIKAKSVQSVVTVANAINDAASALDDGFDSFSRPFWMVCDAYLEAGSLYTWKLVTHSRVASTALVAAGCAATATIWADLDSVYIYRVDVPWHTVTATSGNGGQIEPSGQVLVAEGEDIAFRAAQNSGYRVDRWYVDSQEVAERQGRSDLLLTSVSENTNVRVTFSPISSTDFGLVEGTQYNSGYTIAQGSSDRFQFTIGANATSDHYLTLYQYNAATQSNNLGLVIGQIDSTGKLIPPRNRFWWQVGASQWDREEQVSLEGFRAGKYDVVVFGGSALSDDIWNSKTPLVPPPTSNHDFRGGVETGPYGLFFRAPMFDAYEPDDTPELASPIRPDGSLQHHSLPAGDVDWIKFQLHQLSEVVVTANVVIGDHNTNDLGLRIFLLGPYASDALIAAHYDANGDANIQRLGGNALEPGTYYVKIESDTENDITHCTVTVTATPVKQSPSAPIGISPVSGMVGVPPTPKLESSGFSDPDPDDMHAASQWQISMESDFVSVVWDSEPTTIHRVSITVPADYLEYETTYYWRVRHQDSSNAWSHWSVPVSFTTETAQRTISGCVRDLSNAGISEVRLSTSDGAGSAITDSDGYYSFTVDDGWSGEITPSKMGYDFAPPSRYYDGVATDRTNENYVATFVYQAGSGTEEDPFQVGSEVSFQRLGAAPGEWDKHFVLTADLDLQGASLTPIGTWESPFTGVFNGNGRVIRNAVIDLPESDYVGVFGWLDEGGEIRSIGVEDVTVNGHIFVGGLVGRNQSTISNCHATATVNGDSYVAGLVGWNLGTIRNCYATGVTSGGYVVGGLVGSNQGGAVNSCYATGPVHALTAQVGGLVSQNQGAISNCYATGAVSAGKAGLLWNGGIGGFAGWNRGTIRNCYAAGTVTTDGIDEGTVYIGGFVGRNLEGAIIAAFWDIESSGRAGSAAGRGLPTAQMHTVRTFQNAGWGDNGWVMADGQDYPRLAWEDSDGAPIPTAEPVPLVGDGSEVDPYQVWTADDFALLSWHVSVTDRHIVLMADLDLSGVVFHPVGDLDRFTGVFDGRGHIIRNAAIQLQGSDCIGLFSWIGEGGEICNLGVVEASVTGTGYLAGGLVGYNAGVVRRCYFRGNVNGDARDWIEHIGGLVGGNRGTISNSYAVGPVVSVRDEGFVGDDSVGTALVGGLVGKNVGTVTDSYAESTVSGGVYEEIPAMPDYAGGLVGCDYRDHLPPFGTATASFWDTQTSGQATSAGGEGKTTAEMKAQVTFADAGWDFVETWRMPEWDYPRLAWQAANDPPQAPSGISPPDGATGIGLTPTLQSSAFSDPNPNDAHAASRWRIATNRIVWSDGTTTIPEGSVIWQSGDTTSEKTSIIVPADVLSYGTTYYWQVQHQDNSGAANAWSEWSAPVSFTTAPETVTTHTLSVSAVPAGAGTVSGGGTYNHGQAVSLLATPAAGYRVKAWTGTDDDSSTANSNTVTMTSDKSVTVQFEAIPPATLSISMAGSAEPVAADDQVNYTITYGNTGELNATNTVITEILPAGVSFASASGGGVYNASARTITWTIGTLAGKTAGQTVSFVAKVDSSMAEGGTIRHSQLTIRSDQTGPATAAAVTTTVRDTQPPQVSGQSPADGSEMAPCGGIIRLHVTDGGSGVRYDGGTVTIRIAGDLIYDGAHETSAGVYDTRARDQAVRGVCRRSGSAADYEFTFTPTMRFDYEQPVDVVVMASDVAGNTNTLSYSFITQTRSFGKNAKVNSDTAKVPHDNPATAVDSAGNIWVVWDQQAAAGNTDIYIGKLAAGGSAFGASAAVYQGLGLQSHPVIAVDRSNRLYVAWQSQAANGKWDVYVSRSSNGTTWTEPLVVNVGDPNNTSNQRYPAMAADSREPGMIYVAYEDDRAGNRNIWMATSTNGTVWTETPITSHSANQTQPDVFIDPNDSTAYVLWTDARNAATQGTNIYAASSANAWANVAAVAGTSNETRAVGAAFDTLYLAWVSDTGTLASIRYGNDAGGLPVTGTGIADESGVIQASPSLTLPRDARGTKLFAAWQDSRDVRNNNDTDIYFAEGRSAFGTNILVNDDTGTSAQSAPVVGIDGKGDPYVVWVDERNGNRDIYYAGAVSIDDPMPTTVVTTGTTVTVKATTQVNLQITIPQMPSGIQADEITISEVISPPRMPSGMNEVGLKYEFGPSGLQFATPVTIRIPLAQDGGYSTYRIYRYDPDDLTSPSFPWTERGIHNPAVRVTGVNGTYLEVQVDHFSIYGAAGITAPPSGGGGGGGGGCALAPYDGSCGPMEFALPFVMYVLVLLGMTALRKRRYSG